MTSNNGDSSHRDHNASSSSRPLASERRPTTVAAANVVVVGNDDASASATASLFQQSVGKLASTGGPSAVVQQQQQQQQQHSSRDASLSSTDGLLATSASTLLERRSLPIGASSSTLRLSRSGMGLSSSSSSSGHHRNNNNNNNNKDGDGNGNGSSSTSSSYVPRTITSPSMAQLRARKLMSELKETKARHKAMAVKCLLPVSASSPTASESRRTMSECSDWEEEGEEEDEDASSSSSSEVSSCSRSDDSSNADPETVDRVSRFIDSLHTKKKKQQQQQQPTTGSTTEAVASSSRYRSSLENARLAMAKSPIARRQKKKSFNFDNTARRSGGGGGGGRTKTSIGAKSETTSAVADTAATVGNSSAEFVESSSRAPGKNRGTTSGAESSTIAVGGGGGCGDDDPSPTDDGVKKDVHYYAILKQVQGVVRSDGASTTLGKILADANKRGMSLDAVTEIYKKERFKAAEMKQQQAADATMTMTGGTTAADDGDRTTDDRAADGEGIVAADGKAAHEGIVANGKAIDKGIAADDKTTDSRGVPSRGSAQICKDDAPIREERSRDLPAAKSSPPPSKDADAEKNKLPDVETSISGEIANDMHQLSCLCDQAAALFDEEKSTTNEEGTSHLDVAPDEGAKVVSSDDRGGRAEAAENDVGRDDAAPPTRDRNTSVQQRTRERPAKHSTAGARATIEASPAHRPAANESPRKHLMAEARAKIKASRESPHKNLMAEARAKTRASPAHKSPCKHSTTEAVPKTKASPFHREIPRKDPTAEDVPKIKASPAHQSPRKHSTAKAVSKINASPTHESPRKRPMAHPVPKAKSPTHRPGESNEKECSKKDGRDGATINGKLALQKSQEKIKIASEALPPKEKPNLQNSIERVRRDCDAEISILNDPQSKQRPAEKEEGELDILPTFCMDGAMELSLGYIANRKSSLAAPAKGGRSAAAASGHEDVDAFFSRFSIPKDNGGAMNEIADETSPRASEGEVAADVACSEKVTQSSSPELSDACKHEHDSAESQSPGCDRETFFEGNDAQSVCAEEVPRKAEVSMMVEEEPIGEIEQMEQMRQMEWKAQQEYELREKNKNLPKHLSLWKSPWQRNRIAHSNGSGTSKPAPTSGITAAGECLQMSGGNQRQCFLPPKKRLAGHTGYLNIDFYSLYEATAVQVEDEDIDRAPWEYRDVGQRFLHEKSVESRNWFGAFEITRGNDRVPNPVCRPKSLEVSVTKIPEPGDWSEDWYTTWQSRRDNPNNLVTFSQEEVKEEVVEPSGGGQPLTVDTSFSQEEPSLPLKRVAVEIGSLCPVRVKGGERVSRVHHDFTSSLRHSRWRKKYLVGSMFPRD